MIENVCFLMYTYDKWEKICISVKTGAKYSVPTLKKASCCMYWEVQKIVEVSNAFVVLMGIGTVFVGLICIVILCLIIGLFCRIGTKKEDNAARVSGVVVGADGPAANTTDLSADKRREVIAAVSAALAEEMGTDISAIRIHSFKKI